MWDGSRNLRRTCMTSTRVRKLSRGRGNLTSHVDCLTDHLIISGNGVHYFSSARLGLAYEGVWGPETWEMNCFGFRWRNNGSMLETLLLWLLFVCLGTFSLFFFVGFCLNFYGSKISSSKDELATIWRGAPTTNCSFQQMHVCNGMNQTQIWLHQTFMKFMLKWQTNSIA